ncbi:MAG TPA: macro domain-containing protein [Nitrososphaeraceae archaeon]|nr:macro domain-containing protein [Nitrososphaeraceae archaeon]
MALVNEILIGNQTKLRLVWGDITERNVDAIVNAANSYLSPDGGVAAAIVKEGGRIIQEESDKIGYLPVGNAVMTTAGKLTCKTVIHVVGPRKGEAKENEKFRLVLNNALILAQQNGFKSISIPAISTGIFGFPKDKCAKILVGESIKFVKDNKLMSGRALELIEFCIYDEETLEQFKLVLNAIER